MKLRIIILIIMIIFPLMNTYSKSIWRDSNIYVSGAGLNVGDVIIVSVDDITKLKFTMSFSGEKAFSAVSAPDTDQSAAQNTARMNNNPSATGSANISLSIASRITERLPDGKLKIAGARKYVFNGIINKISVTGIIDPVLVKGRTIHSKELAEFVLDIRGETEDGSSIIKQPPLKEKEDTGGNLSEKEKKEITANYLNKMINELTK